MTDQMRQDLIRLVKDKLGEGATIEQVITHLDAVGVVRDSTARIEVVGGEFYRIMSLPEVRTPLDIEQELSVRYDIHHKHVAKIRLKYANRRAAMKEGRKKVATRAE